MMRFILQDEIRRGNCIEYIKRLDLRKPQLIDIKQWVKRRSESQHNLYWMWVNVIAKSKGDHTPDDLHTAFKSHFLGGRWMHFNPYFDDAGVYHDGRVFIPNSTTTLSTQEFSTYLNKIEAYAHREGITLPYPDDLHYALNNP